MPFDAFTAGVAPGGLRTQNDVRLLICYMLNSVPSPLSRENIHEVLQGNELANYFEITDAISALIKGGNIKELPSDMLSITETGTQISLTLDDDLPVSVKEKALKAAFSLLQNARIEKENKVEIKKMDLGYNVTCHISGGDFDLMKFTVYVPDLFQARIVKKNFHRDPEKFYKIMLASLTGDDF